ncbi:uncharacterized protein A4U43_C02F19780 [Asparagus officinalis]|uniref:Major facilitator superfamily (MFS) profile domain-containing protein n=1 Tax=Asparagus officinalis TaxID=4686 RepID=A0A5P1FJS2_ASPOF|nr:uncharacterized protein A4U43_C02F19780 [Asparagus officinalis]
MEERTEVYWVTCTARTVLGVRWTSGKRRNWGFRTESSCMFGSSLCVLIKDLHIAKREEDIGFYAGFVGSAFMLGRALTSVLWGLVSDHYGRKPVIMISIISVIIFNTLFGLSTSYWMAIATRLLLGSLNGLLGPIKAYAIEVCRAEHQPIGLSLVSTAWGIGLVIGPAIGGFFAQPAEKYPKIFSKESFFGRFPYFLPCFCISLFAVGAFISCFWLAETLHNHSDHDEETDGTPASKKNLFKNWPLMSSIIVYCVFSLHDMAYTEIFSIWAVSDKLYGGLSFSSQDVGEVLAVTGCSLLVFQLFLYIWISKLLGPIISARVAAVITIPLGAAYPFMSRLSGFKLSLVVNCTSVLKNILSLIVITGMFILQNNAVPQHQRGAANGISVTGQSLFKAVAPACAGAIFSWAQKRQKASFLPGDQMVFFIVNVIEAIGFLLTFEPFLVPANKTEQE